MTALKNIIMYVIISLVMTTILTGIIFKDNFSEPVIEDVDLTITATGEKSEISYGSQVRIKSILVNGQPLDLVGLAETFEGWSTDGDLLVAYDIQSPCIINLHNIPDVESIEINMYGQLGSGYVKFDANNYSKTIDLYREDGWQLATWHYEQKGSFAPWKSPYEFLSIFIMVFAYTIILLRLFRMHPLYSVISVTLTIATTVWIVCKIRTLIPTCSGISEAAFNALTDYDISIHCFLVLVSTFFLPADRRNAEFGRSTISSICGGIIRVILWACYVTAAVEFLSRSSAIYNIPPICIALNIAVVLSIALIISSIVGKAALACYITTAIMFFAIAVNYFTLEFRGTVIIPADILAIGTAANVAKNYVFNIPAEMTLCALLMFGGCCIVMPVWKARSFKFARIPALILPAAFIAMLNITDVQDKLNIANHSWKLTMQCEAEGFTLTFFDSIHLMFLQKPEGYSAERIEMLEEKYISDEIDSSSLPNVIVVMSESYADFEQYDGFKPSDELMPFFKSLAGHENTLMGRIQVPVIGGGTSQTEFEFLTGVNNYHFKASSPYDTLVNSSIAALPASMAELGYSSVSLHPEVAVNWSRNQGYPLMGFNKTIFLTEMEHKERIRRYTSDKSFFDETIMIDKATEEPLFLFGITMQNHGGYEEEDFNEPIQIITPEGEFPKATQYINLIKESDNAFKDFIEYYQSQDTPTIILFFGDHLPSVESEFMNTIIEPYKVGNASDNLLTFNTPFLIWANFNLDKDNLPKDGSLVSVSLLQSILMEAANLPMTGWQKFLADMVDNYPVVSSGCVMDSCGNCLDGENIEIVKLYSYLQYALLKGRSSIFSY